jgi:hypothetical protein
VLKLYDAPVENKGFGIAITPGKEFFIDYRDPVNWTDTRVYFEKLKNTRLKDAPETTSQPIYKEDYRIYIEEPDFPHPAIQSNDLNKVRYAQIAVNAYAGETDGGVSSPSTIMAVFREVPVSPVAFEPVGGQVISALKATPANVHGKSAFALRWNKSHGQLKYQVLRAMDETLFSVDNKLRLTRSSSIYDEFLSVHSGFDAVDLEVVRAIEHKNNPKKISALYTGLTPAQLQILASLADNESAYTRISEGFISGAGSAVGRPGN